MKPENRPKTVFEGKEYDDYQATQMQRRVEREIRKQKRFKTAFEAAGLSDAAAAAGSKLRALNEKYRAFSKAAGLPEQRERMRAYTPKTSLSSTVKSDIIRSSGESESSGGYTSIDRVWSIDPTDKAAVSRTVENFAKSFSSSRKEHSTIITTGGEVFLMTGTSSTVNPAVIGPEKLRGSIGMHNHPVPSGETQGDSFSRDDLVFSAKYKTGIEYLVSGERRNAFELTKEFSEEEIYRAWENAFRSVRERAFSGELIIEWEQEEVLKQLVKQLEGFLFYEDF